MHRNRARWGPFLGEGKVENLRPKDARLTCLSSLSMSVAYCLQYPFIQIKGSEDLKIIANFKSYRL